MGFKWGFQNQEGEKEAWKDDILQWPFSLESQKLQPKPNWTEKYMTGWLINCLKMLFPKLIHPDRLFREFSHCESFWEVNWIDESSDGSHIKMI